MFEYRHSRDPKTNALEESRVSYTSGFPQCVDRTSAAQYDPGMRPGNGLASRAKQVLTSAAMTVAEKIDAWENVLTGMGTRTRDKTTAGVFQADGTISDQELTSLYTGSDMAARIVDCVPQECFREGFEILADSAEEIEKAARTFPTGSATGVDGIAALFADLQRWGRLYGGAALVLGADDGGDAADPLREDAIQTFRVARVVDRRWICPVEWYRDPQDPKFGNPSAYQITTLSQSVSVNTVRIHESRLILMGGATTPADVRLSLNGWDTSVLNRCYVPLRQFDSNWKALELLLTDASQGVFKVKDLYMMMAQGNEKALMDRMTLVDMSRSVARSILVDSDQEDFKRDNHSFTGIPDCLEKSALRLAAAAETPVTVLMGQAPAGLNATGDSDLRLWYARMCSTQNQDLKPRIERFLSLLCLAKDGPTAGVLPENLRIQFKPLRQATPKEQAEIYNLKAQGDKTYIDADVLLPEEVALSRFKPDGFSIETQIDRDSREAMLAKPEDETTPTGEGILTATSNEAVVTVNEARIAINLPPLALPGGGPDPDGDLTVAEFRAKREAKGEGLGTEEGAPDKPAAPPPVAPFPRPPAPAGAPARPPGDAPAGEDEA